MLHEEYKTTINVQNQCTAWALTGALLSYSSNLFQKHHQCIISVISHTYIPVIPHFYRVHKFTPSENQRHGHRHAQTKLLPMPSLVCKTQFMRRQSGKARRYSLLLMSEFTTRSDGWTSCSLYCLKLSSSPPAVALCLHLEAGRLWWLMHSPQGSRLKNLEFLQKCFADWWFSRTIFTEWSNSGKKKERKKHQHFKMPNLLQPLSFDKVMACRDGA